MSESSVKDILAKFSQGNGPPVGVRPAVGQKPGKPAKPDHASSNGTKPMGGPKPLVKPGNVMAPNLSDLTAVKLKKPPLPKPPPGQHGTPVTQKPEWLLKPKPKPVTAPRSDGSSLPSPLPSPSQPFSPSFASSPHANESSLHPKPAAKPAPGKKPKPPAPHRKDSLTTPGTPPVRTKPGFFAGEENKENAWRHPSVEDDLPPPVSDSENSSASSVMDVPSKRRSFLHDSKSSLQSGKPMLQPLPPLSILGNAPRKPRKPPNVSLARFKATAEAPVPGRPPKPGLPSPSAPALPARPSAPSGGAAKSPKPTPPLPVPEEGGEDSGEIYDDVEGKPPPVVSRTPVRRSRPFSLIQTMDSDEEEGMEEDCDDIYDDAESTPAAPPKLPAPPPKLPPHPTLTVTSASGDAPPLPSISSIPALHGSGGSSISFPRSAEHSGSGIDDDGEVYDDVSAEDHEELYEALDIDEEGNEVESSAENEQQKKQAEERRKKEEERLKKEQEKQQKKEEEKRRKKEKEDKKKKEKEERDLKKKFNIKGDIIIIDEGIVVEAMDAVYEKLDLQCKAGEKIEILRKEGNPPGKWLARNPGGHYGYVEHRFVRVEGGSSGDFGDVYDDVIGGEDDADNIYDAVN